MAINSKFMQDDEYNIRGVGEQPENQLDSTSLNELITKTPELTDVLNTDQQALSQEITSPTVAETQSIVPNTPEKPLTRLEKLENMMADYESSYKKDLAEARKKDRMLRVGGALGDVLATYINAQNQKRAMVPGIEVQQGAGIGKIAEMFQTAPEVASDIAQRRQALMDQYKQLAVEESKALDRALKERQVSAYEAQTKAQARKAEAGVIKDINKKTEKPTIGEQTIDREFAKKYNEWRTGGKADYEENKQIFDEAIDALEKGKVATGTTSGVGARLPIVRTDTRELETRVRKAVNGMLRATLGAQFTEEEGKRIFEQTFDPFASPEENIKNMQTELNKIEKRARDIESQGKYFSKQKTLSGFESKTTQEEESQQEQNPDVKNYADQYFNGDYNKAFEFLKKRGDI